MVHGIISLSQQLWFMKKQEIASHLRRLSQQLWFMKKEEIASHLRRLSLVYEERRNCFSP